MKQIIAIFIIIFIAGPAAWELTEPKSFDGSVGFTILWILFSITGLFIQFAIAKQMGWIPKEDKITIEQIKNMSASTNNSLKIQNKTTAKSQQRKTYSNDVFAQEDDMFEIALEGIFLLENTYEQIPTYEGRLEALLLNVAIILSVQNLKKTNDESGLFYASKAFFYAKEVWNLKLTIKEFELIYKPRIEFYKNELREIDLLIETNNSNYTAGVASYTNFYKSPLAKTPTTKLTESMTQDNYTILEFMRFIEPYYNMIKVTRGKVMTL